MNGKKSTFTTPEDIGCLEAIEALYAYLDGEIDDESTRKLVEHHIGHCRSCYSRMEMEQKLSERIKKESSTLAPERLEGRIKALMDKF